MKYLILLPGILCLAVFPLLVSAEVENLAFNPSFEDNKDVVDDQWQGEGWLTWGDGVGLQSEVSIDEAEKIDGKQSLFVEPQGADNWHFMIINWPIPLEVGETYTASFWAKAEEDRKLTTKFKADDNSIDWALTDFQITTEWQEYHVTAEAQNGLIKFEIWVAGSVVPLWLDFLYIYEGDYLPDNLPSGAVLAVDGLGKLATSWAEIKSLR